MKTKKIKKKLDLNKITIVKLDREKIKHVKVGLPLINGGNGGTILTINFPCTKLLAC